MSWLMNGVIFLLSLPVSMWLLAQCCALLDQDRPSRYLLRILSATCALLVFLLLTERDWWLPIALGFATVALCHTLGFWLAQRFGVGVTIIESHNRRPRSGIEPSLIAPTAGEHD